MTNGNFVNEGQNESYILKCLELKFNIKVEKQKRIEHYCVDGLYKDLIIEVNEPHHLYNRQFNRDLRKYSFLLQKGYRILICWDNIKYFTKFQRSKLQELKEKFPQIRQTFFNGEGCQVKILSTDGVWSRFQGFTKSKQKQKVIELKFANNNIIGTYDHQVVTQNDQLKTLNDLQVGDVVGSNIIISKQYLNDEIYVYDPVEIEHKHLYIVNNEIVNHQCLIVDEAAFIPVGLAEEFFTSVYPTVSSSKESQIILVSTPNGQGNQFYETWNKAILKIDDATSDGGVKWTPCRIDWWDVPGRDEHWKQIQLESYNGDIVKFNQEFGNCVGKDTIVQVFDTITNQIIDMPISQLYNNLLVDNYNIERSI